MFRSLLSTLALVATVAISATSQASVSFGVFGDANTPAAGIVNTQGNTATILPNLSAGSLASIDVLWVLNGSNSTQISQLGTAAVASFVSNGGVLMYHDREVDAAETVLPGGGGFNIIRDFNDDSNIQVINNTTLVTNGPGGIVNDLTLDGGNSSSHGFAVSGSLPGTSLEILSRTNPNQIVDFTYEFGLGDVYYSTVPLDFYLNGGGSVPGFANTYGPNVAAFAAFLANPPQPVIPEPTMLITWAGLACCAGLATTRRRNAIA